MRGAHTGGGLPCSFSGSAGAGRAPVVGFLWKPFDGHDLLSRPVLTTARLGRELFEDTALLRLNSSIVGDDATDFSALSRGALSEAASLYRGAFIDGFYR
jgi:hypothetical protein